MSDLPACRLSGCPVFLDNSFNQQLAICFRVPNELPRNRKMGDLIIYPQEFVLFWKIVLVPFLFELFRIFFGKGKPSPCFSVCSCSSSSFLSHFSLLVLWTIIYVVKARE
jgi:hypothetical protein